MTLLKRDFGGDPILSDDTPLPIILSHAVAKGAAWYAEFCERVLHGNMTNGSVGGTKADNGAIWGGASFHVRPGTGPQIIAEADKILWGNKDQLGLVPEFAASGDIDSAYRTSLHRLAELQRQKSPAAEPVRVFVQGMWDILGGPMFNLEAKAVKAAHLKVFGPGSLDAPSLP